MPIKHSPKNKDAEDTPKRKEIEDDTTPTTDRKRKQVEDYEISEDELPSNTKNRRLDDFPSQTTSELSLQDIMNELKANKVETLGIRSDIAVLRGDVTEQINGIKSSLSAVTTKVSDLSSEVKGLDARIDTVAKIASDNRKLIGSYKQDKLEKRMEIEGVKNNVIDETNDFKKLAIDIMESFGINIDQKEIEHAFKKEIKLKKNVNGNFMKKIIVVIFANIGTKIRVMKAKRDIKTESSIYFNQSLTVINRSLIFKAKTIVGKKLKVYFARGCVRVQKKDESEITVDDESKLEEVQLYFDQIKNQK
ncbi:hypothetical protein ACKWTF_007120 [Chironomus riparius]